MLIRFLRTQRAGRAKNLSDDSEKRLAQMRAEQEREREKRLHEHFKTHHEFVEKTKETLRDLSHRANAMELDVAELKDQFSEFVKTNTVHREEVLRQLASMEGAAKAFASLARDARGKIRAYFPEATDEEAG